MTAAASELFSGPWLPWFHGDFLRSTQGWTILERGVYFLLLGASWEMGPLPEDHRRLAGIVGAQLDEFDEAWKTVRPKFVRTERGLINHRLEYHRGKQAIRSEKARQSALSKKRPDETPQTDLLGDAPGSERIADAERTLSGRSENAAENHGKTGAFGLPKGQRSASSSELRSYISEKDKSSTRPAAVPAGFHDQVIAAYHKLCPHLPAIKTWPKHRKAKLLARIRERCADGKPADTIAYWESFFESVTASDFLSGRTAKPFTATIDWLLGPENFPKVIEGNYANRKPNGGAHAHG
jgi:uncharacterized protein YdaU (DUF1376 family)